MTFATRKKARGVALIGTIALVATVIATFTTENEGRSERQKSAAAPDGRPATAPAAPAGWPADTPPTTIADIALGASGARVKAVCRWKGRTCKNRSNFGRNKITRFRVSIEPAAGGPYSALKVDLKGNKVFRIRATFRSPSTNRHRELMSQYGPGSRDRRERTKWVSKDRATAAMLSYDGMQLVVMSLARAEALGIMTPIQAVQHGFRFPITPAVVAAHGRSTALEPLAAARARTRTRKTRAASSANPSLAFSRIPERFVVAERQVSGLKLGVKNHGKAASAPTSVALNMKERQSGKPIASNVFRLAAVRPGAATSIPFSVDWRQDAGAAYDADAGVAHDAWAAFGGAAGTAVSVEIVRFLTADLELVSLLTDSVNGSEPANVTAWVRNVNSTSPVRFRVRFTVGGADPIFVDGPNEIPVGGETVVPKRLSFGLTHPGDSVDVSARVEPLDTIDPDLSNNQRSITISRPYPPPPADPEMKKINIKIKLTKFRCVEQNEWWADEPLLYVTGMHSSRIPDRDLFSKSWEDVDDGEERNLNYQVFGANGVDVSPFEAAALHFSLWEKDPSTSMDLDTDDEIGYAYRLFRWDWVKARRGAPYSEEIAFRGDDADYRVRYELVISDVQAYNASKIRPVYPHPDAGMNPYHWVGTYDAVVAGNRTGQLVIDRFKDTARHRSSRQPWGKFTGRFVEGSGRASTEYRFTGIVTLGNYLEFQLDGFDKSDRANPRPQRFVGYLIGPADGRAITGTTKTVDGLTSGFYMTKVR